MENPGAIDLDAIETLRREAIEAGDHSTADLCARALQHDIGAIQACLRVISVAAHADCEG